MKTNILFFITFTLLLNICAFAQQEPESLCGEDDRDNKLVKNSDTVRSCHPETILDYWNKKSYT